jgi:predicted nucleic acid-binding Zn ribbon protein
LGRRSTQPPILDSQREEKEVMPIYEYKCDCNNNIVPFNTSILNYKETYPCGECGADMKRHYTPIGAQFTGSGFYSTDNRKK